MRGESSVFKSDHIPGCAQIGQKPPKSSLQTPFTSFSASSLRPKKSDDKASQLLHQDKGKCNTLNTRNRSRVGWPGSRPGLDSFLGGLLVYLSNPQCMN